MRSPTVIEHSIDPILVSNITVSTTLGLPAVRLYLMEVKVRNPQAHHEGPQDVELVETHKCQEFIPSSADCHGLSLCSLCSGSRLSDFHDCVPSGTLQPLFIHLGWVRSRTARYGLHTTCVNRALDSRLLDNLFCFAFLCLLPFFVFCSVSFRIFLIRLQGISSLYVAG